MRKFYLLPLLLVLYILPVKADEGMWILPSLQKENWKTMKKLGFQLSDSDVYNQSGTSLKDAVVVFGNGCTGEIVSENGLIFTNHHCGYDAIQELSSLQNNYLQDGFWAKSYNEELPAPNLSVTFLKRMDDVTNQILSTLSDTLTNDEQNQAIALKIEELKKEASEGKKYKVDIKPFFEANRYYRMVYEKYTDVRLVGTPPSSIGKFGFDTDNWMWPRHTGDFSIFRVYASPDGKPANYSKNNVPLTTKTFLPISLKGVEKGDYAMTIGYPGSTDRYLTSWGIKQLVDVENSLRILARGQKQDIWMADMKADPKIDLQYASKFARSSNYWKNSIGMNRGVAKLNVVARKELLEDSLQKWINQDTLRVKKYGTVLSDLKTGYQEYNDIRKGQILDLECLINGIEIYKIAYSVHDIITKLEKDSKANVSDQITTLKNKLTKIYKDYSSTTDQKVMARLLETYLTEMNGQKVPSFLAKLNSKKTNEFVCYSNKLFKKSMFANQSVIMEFLSNPKSNLLELKKDPAYKDAAEIYDHFDALGKKGSPVYQKITNGNKNFIAALMEMKPDKNFYPDANFTMRLSYGSVGDYQPQDGVIYKHFTTLGGVIEKEVPGSYEFSVPTKLKELYLANDYGSYADKDGTLHICFTSNNDITGGNSGSPVINKEGYLIGLAFDGNWEAMSGDITFEPNLQKTICVDIRYVLFVIDKFAGATNLIQELKIVE